MLRSIIYDSNTGNTREMAELIREGAATTGAGSRSIEDRSFWDSVPGMPGDR